ncbi:MAG: NAD(P)/FAD-dependent oxidoreductase, partial [Candidatus Omnitrophica bacterium]|nr:NAD(P)/FAD-dependent oxidoreductase [Candidatus Omnitrophota bacterium]
RSRQAASKLREGLSFLCRKNRIDVIFGAGSFIDEKTMCVITNDAGDIEVKADKFLIATGSSPEVLSVLPFDGERVIASSDAIRLREIPETILIVGGGAIGVELASYFNILGSGVTIMEREETILPLFDREMSKRLQAIFKRRGIRVVTGESLSAEDAAAYERVIVSVGRVPSSGGIGLDKANVKIDERGYIVVDREMRTTAENIYAAGDVINSPMLAHVASAEGEIAAVSAAGGNPEALAYDCVPNVVYSRLRLASVGRNEEQLKAEDARYKTGKQSFRSNGRAVAQDEEEGFIKVIADRGTHRLFGAHILGVQADELIHEFALALRMGLTTDSIVGTSHAHPTFSETIVDACRAVFDKPIHGQGHMTGGR